MKDLMLLLPIMVYVNMIRWSDLYDTANVFTFKDYVNYANKTTITYNLTIFIIYIGYKILLNS